MNKNKWSALVVALIISLAEVVIIYELWLAGTWLLDNASYGPYISGAKTASFILLFIGSLIAEMQRLNKSTKRLLFSVVVLLGLYQTFINFVVNYDNANLPQNIVALFAPVMTLTQSKIAFAASDAIIRSSVVVLMWLVTGQVWLGVASMIADDTRAAIDKLQATIVELQQRNVELQTVAGQSTVWMAIPKSLRAKRLAQLLPEMNGSGEVVIAAAKNELGGDTVSRSQLRKPAKVKL
jgi:hypothetical protein